MSYNHKRISWFNESPEATRYCEITQLKVGTELKSNVTKYLRGKKTGTYESLDCWKFLKTKCL